MYVRACVCIHVYVCIVFKYFRMYVRMYVRARARLHVGVYSFTLVCMFWT